MSISSSFLKGSNNSFIIEQILPLSRSQYARMCSTVGRLFSFLMILDIVFFFLLWDAILHLFSFYVFLVFVLLV